MNRKKIMILMFLEICDNLVLKAILSLKDMEMCR